MQRAIWILWPAFIVGGIAEVVFFTLFDPEELQLFGDPIALSRGVVYTLGFFAFWAFAALPSVIANYLRKSSYEINRLCPLEPGERPPGCPKRVECEQCQK
jgi:hypothetical protein